MACKRCKSEMVRDYDYFNRVRVVVCSNPSCLSREYPDYPCRNSNQEICYLCGNLFTFAEDETAVLCKECKTEVGRSRGQRAGRIRKEVVRSSLLCSMA